MARPGLQKQLQSFPTGLSSDSCCLPPWRPIQDQQLEQEHEVTKTLVDKEEVNENVVDKEEETKTVVDKANVAQTVVDKEEVTKTVVDKEEDIVTKTVID